MLRITQGLRQNHIASGTKVIGHVDLMVDPPATLLELFSSVPNPNVLKVGIGIRVVDAGKRDFSLAVVAVPVS